MPLIAVSAATGSAPGPRDSIAARALASPLRPHAPQTTDWGIRTERMKVQLCCNKGYTASEPPPVSWSAFIAMRKDFGIGRARPAEMKATCTSASTRMSTPRITF